MLDTSALDATLFSGDPLLVPSLLALVGLSALLAASLRRRWLGVRGRRAAIAAYTVLAAVAFVVAAGSIANRARLFWGVSWEQDEGVLVLDRLAPLPDLRIPRADVSAVTEVTLPEIGIAGERPSAQFVVRTRAGVDYWSAPVYRRSEAERARRQLAEAPGRLERFLIGSALP